MSTKRKFALVLALVGLLAGLVWTASPLLMAVHAKRIAQSRPYCLFVSNTGSSGTREVTRLKDVAWVRAPRTCANTSCDWHMTFHAVMVVEGPGPTEFYNWSYSRMGWQPIRPAARRDLYIGAHQCRARTGFLSAMPW